MVFMICDISMNFSFMDVDTFFQKNTTSYEMKYNLVSSFIFFLNSSAANFYMGILGKYFYSLFQHILALNAGELSKNCLPYKITKEYIRESAHLHVI